MNLHLSEHDKIIKETSVFLVDDERFMRNLVGRVLEDLGLKKVEIFEDGFEVLKKLTMKSNHVDVIILDLQMPNINGFELLEQIRTSEKVENNQIPVIILSGHSAPKFLMRTAELGIHGYLVKPVTGAKLKDSIIRARTKGPINPDALRAATKHE